MTVPVPSPARPGRPGAEHRADLAGVVSEVPVAVGDLVAPGELLLLLESMKMEIPVLAEVGGLVTAVAVSAGESVREGHLLVVVRPTPDGAPRPAAD